jgi:hypothetical protein
VNPGCLGLTEVGLGVRVDIEVLAPLDLALEDGDEALEALDAHGLLLVGRGPQLHGLATLRDLGQVVDEALKDVGQREVTVIVDVDVHHALRICARGGDRDYSHFIRPCFTKAFKMYKGSKMYDIFCAMTESSEHCKQ